MTRQIVLGIWALVAVLLLACEALSMSTHRRVAGVGDLLRRLSAGRGRLVAVFVGWMWVGWHFFAR